MVAFLSESYFVAITFAGATPFSVQSTSASKTPYLGPPVVAIPSCPNAEGPGPPTQCSMPGHHVEPYKRLGLRGAHRFLYVLVVGNAVPGRDRRIIPTVIENQFAAASVKAASDPDWSHRARPQFSFLLRSMTHPRLRSGHSNPDCPSPCSGSSFSRIANRSLIRGCYP